MAGGTWNLSCEEVVMKAPFVEMFLRSQRSTFITTWSNPGLDAEEVGEGSVKSRHGSSAEVMERQMVSRGQRGDGVRQVGRGRRPEGRRFDRVPGLPRLDSTRTEQNR